MQLTDLTSKLSIANVGHYTGNAPTGAKAPYTVTRPLTTDPGDVAVCGSAVDWDQRFSIYCVGASVEASYNLATLVLSVFNGSRLGGTTASAALGYSGAPVEGNYETQVTVQALTGGL